jgi:hypothetical protein
MKKTLLINKDRFLDWYFDEDLRQDFFKNFNVLDSLNSQGTFTITASSILDACGYIPEYVVEDGQDIILYDCGEVDTTQYDSIEFSNNK